MIKDCVILAGGLGTRMSAHFSNLPKCMIPVCDRPFVDWQLDWLKQNGIKNVLFLVGHQSEILQNHLTAAKRKSLTIKFLHDGPSLLGTAGALRRAWDEGCLPDVFFLMYGDSYLPLDLQPIDLSYVRSMKDVLMVVHKNQNKFDKSNVQFNGGTVSLYDKFYRKKPMHEFSYIDYGLAVWNRKAIGNIAQGPADLADIYHRLSIEGRLAGYETHRRFYEIGSMAGLNDLESYLSSRTTLHA